LDFSDKSIEEAKNALNGFYDLFTRLNESEDRVTADKELEGVIERCRVAFRAAMDDDFNTSVAIAELQRLKSDINKLLSQGLSTEPRKIAREEFRSLGDCLGLFRSDNWQFNASDKHPHSQAHREAERQQAESRDLHPGTRELLFSRRKLPPSDLSVLTDEEIEGKLVERNEARKQKDFKKADEIRQFLASHGIVIEDKPDGTSRWKR
jgi:cysteinyl-tRNA synthetase